MVVNKDLFREYVKTEVPYNLISITDFNSLIAKSQERNKPIFELTENELGEQGKILTNYIKSQSKFRQLFFSLAGIISELIKLSVWEDKEKFAALIMQELKYSLQVN